MSVHALPRVRLGTIALPWRTLLLTAVALALYLGAGAAPELWVYDRLAISQGEWWRLISGHWVHSDLQHAVWDIGALFLLGLLFESRLQGKLFSVLGLATLGIDLWLWRVEPSLTYYCGLSGILNGLLALGLMQWWREDRHPLILMTGLGAVLKIAWEMAAGEALLTATAWSSVPEVHAVGFFCGLLLVVVVSWLNIGIIEELGLRSDSTRWGRAPPCTLK
ncbi:MAG: rhombosortase [Candidatus Thiodiazotropha sp.]